MYETISEEIKQTSSKYLQFHTIDWNAFNDSIIIQHTFNINECSSTKFKVNVFVVVAVHAFFIYLFLQITQEESPRSAVHLNSSILSSFFI